jgi:hypothetical protein
MTNYVVLSKTEHSNVKIQPAHALPDYSGISFLPIYGIEIPRLSLKFPIAFAPDGEDNYSLSILCSLTDEMSNGWLDHNNKWAGDYLPAIIRQRPFSIVKGDGDRLLVCIDEDSELIGDEGEAIFVEGELTENMLQVKEFLEAIYVSGQRVQQIILQLKELELIIPWDIQFLDEKKAPTQSKGAFRIDEERLLNLSDQQWLLLKNEGALPLIYGQLLSMGNLKALLSNLAAKYTHALESEEERAVLDFSLGDEEDSLIFDAI